MAFETILVENETKKEIVLAEYGVRIFGTAAASFLDLSDTPGAYAGSEDYTIKVNSAGTGLEFVNPEAGAVNSVFGRGGDVVAETGDYDVSQVTGALGALEEDTAPVLGGNLDMGGYELVQQSGSDAVIDVKGLASGNSLIIKSDATEVIKLSFDSGNSEFILDLDNSGLSTRLVGLPNNSNPIPSEALSYQFLIDNGVLNPMIANLNANKNDVTDTNILFFGDSGDASASKFPGVQAVNAGSIPAITSSHNAGFTTLPLENTILIVPEVGQDIMFSADGGNSISYSLSVFDGAAGQVLTTDGAGKVSFQNASGEVDSVDGRTGNVTLDDLYANIVHTHTEADITNLDKYTQAEVDTHISDSMTAHVNAPDPHPQYLTVNDLPETLVSWYTNNVSAVDPAYLKVSPELPSEPESSIQATAVTQGVPVLLGQWLREPVFDEPFTLFETTSTFQFDFDSSDTNSEFYVEFWKLSSIGGVETLLATSDNYPLTSDRQTYTGTIIVPGPINIEAGDRTFTRIYINKNSGGPDPTVTLFMEGNGISRVVTTTPIATFPAPHASSHEVGGTDQISHDLIAGANGFDSHATIDSKILALETNAFLDGDTIDNGTY